MKTYTEAINISPNIEMNKKHTISDIHRITFTVSSSFETQLNELSKRLCISRSLLIRSLIHKCLSNENIKSNDETNYESS